MDEQFGHIVKQYYEELLSGQDVLLEWQDANEESHVVDWQLESREGWPENLGYVEPLVCSECGYVSQEEFAEHNCIGREAAAAHDAARPEW